MEGVRTRPAAAETSHALFPLPDPVAHSHSITCSRYWGKESYYSKKHHKGKKQRQKLLQKSKTKVLQKNKVVNIM